MTTDWLPKTYDDLEKGCLRVAIFFFLCGMLAGGGIITLIHYIWKNL